LGTGKKQKRETWETSLGVRTRPYSKRWSKILPLHGARKREGWELSVIGAEPL